LFTTGSKWFFGLGFVSLVLAAAYGWTSGGDGLGPVTAGYNGGVGDHLGYPVLLSISGAAFLLGIVSLAARDAEPRALAELAGTDEAPVASAPAHLAYWPAVGAFGASLVVLGLVISNVLFIVGFLVLLAVLVEWMVLAWSDRATGDPDTNRMVRDRLMGTYEVPLTGVLIAGGAVVAFSRVFLTASKEGAVWIATAIGVIVLIIGALIAVREKLSRDVLAGVLALCAVGVVTVGIVSAARGERTIEPHHAEEGHETPADEGDHETPAAEDELPADEHEGDAEEPADGGLRPFEPEGTQRATTTTTEAAG
jgi:hypothetical protein